jgi:hypothetical protein
MSRSRKFASLTSLVIAAFIFSFACSAEASVAFETTGFLSGTNGATYSFTVGQEDFSTLRFSNSDTVAAPSPYQITLSDLSFGLLDFDYLALSLSTAKETLASLVGPGSFTVNLTPGVTYFVNLFGAGGGTFNTGLYGVEAAQASAVPIPGSILLLGSSLLSLMAYKRRNHHR